MAVGSPAGKAAELGWSFSYEARNGFVETGRVVGVGRLAGERERLRKGLLEGRSSVRPGGRRSGMIYQSNLNASA